MTAVALGLSLGVSAGAFAQQVEESGADQGIASNSGEEPSGVPEWMGEFGATFGAQVGAHATQRAALGSAGVAPTYDATEIAIQKTFAGIERAEQLEEERAFRSRLTSFSQEAVATAQQVAMETSEAAYRPPEEVDEDASYFVRTRLVDPERLARTGGAAHRFGETDIEALEYDDPTALLQQVPGVAVRKEDGYGLRPNIGIRGANAERSKKVTLMEDGILFAPAPYSAPAAYYFPIVSRMIGVEVFKGPSSVRFGPHTVGGAVNWVTRGIPGDTSAGFDINVGRFLTGKAHGWAGTSNEWGGVLLEGVQWRSDGFKELDGGGDTGFDKTELMAKGRINTDPAASTYNALQLKIGWSRERSDETYMGLTDEDFADNPYRRYRATQLDLMEWWRTQVELRHTLELGTAFQLETVAYRQDFDRSWRKFNNFGTPNAGGGFDPVSPSVAEVLEDPAGGARGIFYDLLTGAADSTGPEETLVIGTNARRFVSQGVQSTADWRTKGDGWGNTLEVGARLHSDWIERFHTEEGYLMREGELVADDRPTAVSTDNRGEALAIALHALDQLDYGSVSLSPGLRFEHVITSFEAEGSDRVESTQTVLIPGLGAYWEFVDTLGVLAGVHRGFSPAAPEQGEGVEPETAVNYEAGLRHFDSETGQLLEVVGYFSDYQNLLGQCTFSAGCSEEDVDDQFNAGEVNIYGVEVVGATAVGLPGAWSLPLRLTYTFTQSEFLGAFSSDNPQYGEVSAGDELPYVPTHQGSARVGLQHTDGAVNVAATYVGEMREEAGQGDEGRRTDRYVVVDLLGAYNVWGPLEAYVQFHNLANAQPIASRRPFGARPIRPFHAAVGLRGEF